MAKIKKAPKVGEKAPKVEKETVTVDQAVEYVNSVNPDRVAQNTAGLDPNRRMDLIRTMHETFRQDQMAPQHTGFSPEAVGQINKINAAMQVAALVCEVTLAKNEFTMLMSPEMVEQIKLIGGEMGVSLKENLLPAPNENNEVAVPSAAITVSKETKKAAEEEAELVESKPIVDPTQIKTKEDLCKALGFILADAKACARPYDRIVRLIDFYTSYLYFTAGDDQAKKDEIKNMPKDQLFSKAIEEMGTLPFSSFILAKLMYTETSKTKSPIPAFCMFRRASLNQTTGYPTVEDKLAASFVRILVSAYANVLIANDTESIATCNESIKVLSKNKKQNAKAIEKEENKIKAYTAAIESYREVISYVTNPEGKDIENFVEAYNNKDHENYKFARRVGHNIFDTYYPGIKMQTVKPEILVNNLHQYAGVIVNMFRDPLAQLQLYSESNITELEFVEEKGEEAKK